MVYDNLDNISTYKYLSPDIYLGLEYLKTLTADVPCGEYILSENVKAIVSEYITQDINNKGFESHKEYVDIQYNIVGKEIISYYPIIGLHISVPYDKKTDICFYHNDILSPLNLLIGEKCFAIFFPQDGHMPKLRTVEGTDSVKKVVIKIKL